MPRSICRLLASLCATGAFLPALQAQTSIACWTPPPSLAAPGPARARAALNPRTAVATRWTGTRPRIDGRLDEDAWCAAPPVADFVESGPSPGALATLPTVARVLFDDDAIYVAVRLSDPHPDSIVAPYPRRDDETTSDWVFLEIDSRFDRRSGFSFGVNPRGVQVDGTWSADVDYDAAWNGVWASAARVDSAGWTVEYRIEYSQLTLGRSRPGDPMTWGINVYRYTPHRGETSNWSPRLPSVVGVVSHFNELRGLSVPPRRAARELVAYSAMTGAHEFPEGPAAAAANDVSAAAGGDLRLRPTATSSVALSIHPDFGQVEADPSQVNLTTFETFLPEQRPLFVEGADVFQLATTLDFASRGTSFSLESPFYSRRIGRAPRIGCPDAALHCREPRTTTLLGAARFSARTDAGWSGGLFSAWTAAEYDTFADSAGTRHRALAEPLTSFSVARAVREIAGSRAAVGFLATSVDRFAPDARVDSVLPGHAVVAGMDGRLRLAQDHYEVSGFTLASRVAGSSPAIGALRHESLHGYDRSDSLGGAVPSPAPSHTLTGMSAQARLSRIDGRLLWGVAGRVVTRGFESNDAGFQRNADWLLLAGHWTYRVYRPGHFVRRWSVGSSQLGMGWTTGGLRRAAVVNATATADLRSYWGGSISLDHEFPASDPEVLRGGPALRLPARQRWAVSAYTDVRRRWQLTMNLSGRREPGSRSTGVALSPDFATFVTDRLQLGITPAIESSREGWQYADQVPDGAGRIHYVLGALHQWTSSLTARATYAFSAHLTLQLYTQAFLSAGRYDGLGEVVAPAAARAADRVATFGSRAQYDSATQRYVVDSGRTGAYRFGDPAFSLREFHLNLLLRWEVLPGSTAFVVWTQERSDRAVGAYSLTDNSRALWRTAPTNTVAVKLSYWLAW
jgi:uncharacterized protein DUF5916/cellulose/xylan binding protein with CBM9 domain